MTALGLTAIRLPLFQVQACAWAVPDPAAFDALLLTSANAARLAGPGLCELAGLPVFAVGETTATAARGVGLHVTMIGEAGGAALVERMRDVGVRRALHLAGRDRTLEKVEPLASIVTVYRSDPRILSPDEPASLRGGVALLHSTRAARRLAEIADRYAISRRTVRVAAISTAVAAGAGAEWDRIVPAVLPDDEHLLTVARELAD